jgi:hypothetical protein
VGGMKQVARVAILCALAAGAITAPAHAVGEGLVGDVVQRVAQSLPPVVPPAPAPAPAPAAPAPPTPAAPAPAPAAPAAPVEQPAAPSTPSPATPAPSPAAPARRAASKPAASARPAARKGSARARGSRGRGGKTVRRGVRAGAASSDRAEKKRRDEPATVVTASAAQVEETADPVATGAQPSDDSSGALPFTGSAIALLAGLGLLVMTAGFALRRVAGA